MTKLSVLAKLTCAPGKNDELEAALAALIEAADEEPGLEVYSVHRDGDTDDYWFFEVYADQAAVDAHGKGDAVKAGMRSVGACLAGAPEVIRTTPIAAKGLDI